MKIVSWNVNGIRAASKKGFCEFVEDDRPDILCLQETKAQPEQYDLEWVESLGYHHFWNSADKKGYSGTTIWCQQEPNSVSLGMGSAEHDGEGRVIVAAFDKFQLVTVYTPNSKRGLTRLDYRQIWDRDFLKFVRKLNKKLPVIFCGDLNCAHQEIDLANPKSNRRNAGFTDEERAGLDKFIAAGFIDSFRQFDQSPGKYTWWTVRTNARERNIGWRLDYFFVAQEFWNQIKASRIREEVMGSDHCPVELVLK